MEDVERGVKILFLCYSYLGSPKQLFQIKYSRNYIAVVLES